LTNQEALVKNRRSFRPSLPAVLEDRVVMSHGGVHTLATHIVALTGSVQGHESQQPGSGATILSGSGSVQPLGSVQINGSLRETGAEPTTVRLTVTMKEPHGSLLVTLKGLQFGPVSVTQNHTNLTYTILAGTGADRGDRGTGHATLTETFTAATAGQPASREFSLSFGNTTTGTGTGPVSPGPTSLEPPVNLSLNGAAQATYTKVNGSGTTDRIYLTSATGLISPLGDTTVSGYLDVQTDAPSAVTGNLMLTTSTGTVALQVTGQQTSSGVYGDLTYTVIGATGSEASVSGTGTLQLEFGSAPLILDPGPGYPHGGQAGSYGIAFGGAQLPVLPPN
jgi:hypothetical protein